MKALSTVAFAVAFLEILLLQDASGVRVDVSPTLSGTAECRQGPDCISIGNALRNASSSTTLYLLDGTHHIDQFIPIYGLYDVSIIGAGGDDIKAVITCADSVGLAFVNITNLTIMNVRIEGCGLTGQNLTETLALLDGVVEIFFNVPSEATIAVFLGHVENLTMQHAVVTNTSGLGLVGINVIGTSSISQVDFTFNIRPSSCFFPSGSLPFADPMGKMIGGGAYFLYQDYSLAYQNMYHNQQYSLNINETNFIKNSECTLLVYVEISFRDSRALQEVGYAIGGAGGLGLVLAQLHYGVDIITTSAMIQNNTAVFGSGVHVGIFSGVRDSHIVFSNTKFIMNGVPSDALTTAGVFSVGGGGLAIFNDLIRPEGIENVGSFCNRNLDVNITNSDFTDNGVQVGGGAYIHSEYISPIRDTTDALMLNFINCNFERNSALLGSALDVIELKGNGRFIGMQVSLNNIVVSNNKVVPINSGVSVSLSDNSAIMDIRGVNCTISGVSNFSSNIGTAMHAEQSVIGIAGSVTFENNIGVYGGAIRLVSYSYLIMTSGARLYLRENVGRVLGGALYVDLLGSQSSSLVFDDCFLYFTYHDFGICNNCSDLNSTGVYIEFSNNFAPSGGIVYGSSLQQCPWAVPLQQQYENLTTFEVLDRHYPNIVNFGNSDPQGSQNVATSPVQLVIENEQTTYFVAPGEQLNVNVSAIDNFRQNVVTVVSSYAIADQPVNNTVISIAGSNAYAPLVEGNASTVPIRIFGTPNQTLTVTLFATGISARVVQTQISLELGFCGSGFEYSNTNHMCTCSPLLVRQNIQCVITNQTLIVPNNLWFGQVTGSGDLAVSSCSNGYCKSGTRYVSVKNGSVDYDVQCDQDLNRVGVLCGSCPDGFSVVLGSNRCLKCSNAYVALFLIFALLGILLIFAISYLRITITAGYLNGALFYANIVALYGRILVPTDASGGRYVLASFLTLNLGIETCLHSGLSPLERVWWKLSFPLYLVILMILTTLLVRYCKCFKVSRGAGLSTIEAFATLMIMCYVSVLESCVELLGPVDISTLNGENFKRWVSDPTVPYFQNAHGFLAFIACVLIVFYIIPLPFFLLFPSLVFRTKYLNRFKPFYDVFWNPFEPQFRFWLGLRLIFRWVPFILVYFADSPDNTYITSIFLVTLLFFQLMFKPFMGTGRNALDGYFLLNLIILISGSVYFNAVAESNSGTMREQVLQLQTAISTTIITFGYLGFAVIFVYHMFDRFPKLKNASLRVIHHFKYNVRKEEDQKMPGLHNTETSNEPPVKQSTDIDAQHSIKKETQSKIVTVTELREPLLEDAGTAETASAPPFVLTGARDLTV